MLQNILEGMSLVNIQTPIWKSSLIILVAVLDSLMRLCFENCQLEHLAFYLIELCLIEYEALKFKPSLLCASAIYVAQCTLQNTPAWTPLLSKHAHYEESQIRHVFLR